MFMKKQGSRTPGRSGGRPGGRPGGKPGGRFQGGSQGRFQDRERRPYGSGSADPVTGRFLRKKINRFYTIFPEKTNAVDFKDTERLLKFLTEKGKIIPRRMTGLTAKQQRMLARAIKRARQAGLLPFQVD